MKKLFSLLIALLFAFSAFGCAKIPAPAGSDTTVPNTGNPDTHTGEEDNTPQDRSALKKDGISAGIYSVKLPFELAACNGMIISGNTAVFSGTSDEGRMGVFFYDTATGESYSDFTTGCGMLYGFEDGTTGLISDNGNIYSFTPVSHKPMPIAVDNRDFTCSFLSDGSLYRTLDAVTVFFDKTGKELLRLDLAGIYDFSSVRYLWDGFIYLTAGKYGSAADVLKLDVATGEYTVTGTTDLGYDLCISESFAATKTYGEAAVSMYRKSDALIQASRHIPLSGKNEGLFCAEDGYIATRCTAYGRSEVGIYGADGKLLYFGCPTGDTEAVLVSSSHDEEGLLLCYRNFVTGKTSVFYIEIRELSGAEKPVLDKDAESPFKDGITVLSGTDAVLEFRNFSAEPITDANIREAALSAVNNTVAEFPVGFFDELLLGKSSLCRSLVICLTGKLTPFSEGSISYPGGFAYSEGSVHYIVVDITHTDNVKSTLCHEIMHIIDSYLAAAVPGDVYPRWYKYVPADNAYFNSYVDSDGNEINDFGYTEKGQDSSLGVWFATPYSRTFAAEDRAVLFSLMFTHNPYYVMYAHIKARMDYLADVFRENFESVRNADRVIWEY